jgi:hypothetical protein
VTELQPMSCIQRAPIGRAGMSGLDRTSACLRRWISWARMYEPATMAAEAPMSLQPKQSSCSVVPLGVAADDGL